MKAFLRFLPVLLYASFIFGLSSLPGRDVPSIGINDKVLHFILYSGFGIFLYFALRRFWVAVVVGLLYACSDEWHQSFVPGRAVEILDICADLAGVIAGSWLLMKLRALRK